MERINIKQILNLRKKNCIAKFLVKEIAIIKPRVIICLGRFAYDEVKSAVDQIDQSIEIVQIMHYSNRASLTMTIEDKINIIWPMELGILSAEDARGALVGLKHLGAKIKNLKG